MPRRVLAIAVMLAAAVLFVGWGMARQIPVESDGAYYARAALAMRGASTPEAILQAAQTRCGSLLRTHTTAVYEDRINAYLAEDPQAATRATQPLYTTATGPGQQQPSVWLGRCTVFLNDHQFAKDPRYFRIFESRPLYPATALLLTDWLGLEQSMRLVSAVGGALAGILLALAGRVCGLSWWAALLSQIALYGSLFGHWTSRPFAEGLAAALAGGLVLGVCLAAKRRYVRLAIAMQLVCAVLLVPAKSHAAVLIGATMLLVLVGFAIIQRSLRLRTVLPGPVVTLIGGLSVPTLAGWASVIDSWQDLATNHYARRNVAHPFRMYRETLRTYLVDAYQSPVMIVETVVVAVIVIAAIALVRDPAVWVAILGPLAIGVGSVIAHPVSAPSSRLLCQAWPGILLAAALLVDLAARKLRTAAVARRSP